MIAIVGATGHTGRPAAEALLDKGEKVRVIGRDSAKLASFASRGAEPFAANVEDAAAMTKAFEGAEAVYALIPQSRSDDVRAYQESVTDSLAAALAAARGPYAVTLSSMGAQFESGTGPIVGLHGMEQKLNKIAGLHVLHLRPTQFMENLLMSIPPLRTMGFLPGASPGDQVQPWIATKDIGAHAALRLAARDFSGSSIQELTGPRDASWKELATLIGNAIGKPRLNYMHVPFIMLEPGLVQMGMPKKTAALMVEMLKAMNAGKLAPQTPRTPQNTTPTTLESFIAEVFVPAYQAKATTA
ncbi:MAG: NAD(P)H-binding protein [Candidatus Acidiferrales bacterium]